MENLPHEFKGRFYLILAVVIFGTANAFTRKLTEIGEQHFIDGRNPISFCNVLFVGNLCALILLLIIYRQEIQVNLFQRIKLSQWLNLLFVALINGALVPALFFNALSITSVNNIVLVSQIEIPFMLIVSICFLSERVNKWILFGSIFSFVGVFLTVLLDIPNQGISIMSNGSYQQGGILQGELMVLIATIFKVISNLVSKTTLKTIPLGFFCIFRTLVGTIAFFVAAIILYGFSHFAHVTSPFLWQWMLIYSAVIVVIGQLAWFQGLKLTTANEVSWANAFNPIAGILGAYFILGESPTTAQYLGGIVIILGIILNQWGLHSQNITYDIKEMEETISFKGF
ncbi:DMT family transporter [Cyanobacterium sp. Dongsha4]|uniref:DMT family transporter n=1 Tax=Cyanobacterium sp. DS4 TaxID=2878255 RepID=UPI002E81F1B7|nr:DMT family transporter [Cyanobacterium sp. Dongsha4]WVL01274.1 DMT family transporter [Cyanobacterium sp. Dongsha4]